MGEVILNDDDIKRKLLLKTKLAFILDTWWGNPLKKEKKSAMYIVAAYLKTMEDKNIDDINFVQNSVEGQQKFMTTKFDEIEQKMIEMGSNIDVINRNIAQEVINSPMRKTTTKIQK